MRETRWYVVDHDRDDAVVRGPYDNVATASAVRAELERRGHYAENGNLWIIPRAAGEADHGD